MILDKPPLVRLIVGQHLYALMRNRIDTRTTTWLQIFLDEMPQLQRMDVLQRAIEAGRNYNIRLWMAMQWKGQIEDAYGERAANGMIASCGVRAYMNPSVADGLANKLSEDIGSYEDDFDGTRRAIFSPQALDSLAFADNVITFEGGRMHRLKKHPYHDDKVLRAMEGASD